MKTAPTVLVTKWLMAQTSSVQSIVARGWLKDFLYRKTGSQLVHRPLRLAGMCRHEDRFFRRLRRLWILLRFCFIENTDLIRHDIVLLLAGRTEAGTLRVEQEFIHSLELLAHIRIAASHIVFLYPTQVYHVCCSERRTAATASMSTCPGSTMLAP